MSIKKLARSFLNFLHIDLNKGLEYDRLTKDVLKKVIRHDSHCIDVGCHEGEILDIMLSLAPDGNHVGFEPIPEMYLALKNNYASRATIYGYALSDSKGTATFQVVKNAPAYSGLQRRNYNIPDPQIQEITVEVTTLDAIIPPTTKIALLKIDVEGGELAVMKGGHHLLLRDKPVLIFECGLGASDYYGTQPEEVYRYLNADIGLNIATLRMYLQGKQSLTLKEFSHLYATNKEYYFVAFP